MKLFILKSVVFVLFILTLTRVIGIFDNKDKFTTTNGDALKALKMTEFDSLNLLFMGNSYCYSSIAIPLFDSLNRRTFNLGIATTGLNFYQLLWMEYSNTVKKLPDTVCILLSPMTFAGQADNWNEYPIHRYLQHDVSNEKVVIQFNQWTDYPFLLFNSCKKGITNLLTRNPSKPDSSDFAYLYYNKGFVIDSSITSNESEKKITQFYTSLIKDKYSSNNTQRVLDLAAQVQDKGCAVIFYETPTNSLNNYFTKEYLNAYNKTLDEVALKHHLIRKPENFTRTDYRNIDHTNTQGAYKYTTYFIQSLISGKP
jgi:hypothetical protein